MICFRQSRPKLAFVTALFAAWTLVLAFMGFVCAYAPGLWPYLGLSLFAPLTLAFAVATGATAMSLHAPATLTADADGVVFKTWRHEQHITWTNIAEFIVLPPTSALRSPACELKEGPRKFVSFGRNWEKTAEEIVAGLGDALPPLPQ